MIKVRRYCYLFFSLIFLNSCYLINAVKWQEADMQDYKKFASNKVDNSGYVFQFKQGKSIDKTQIKLPAKYKVDNLEDLLRKTKTLSFLIIKNDSIISEDYYSATNAETIYPSFSVSKSVVSLLTGIAIDEGYIKSTQEAITNYLKFFKDERFNKITIEDLLNMKSGIKFRENYNSIFSDVVKYYYGEALQRYVRHLRIKEAPGQRYEYLSVNTVLLGMVIESAVKMPISDFLEKKIWMPLGMEYDANWSVDSKRNGNVKTFCCLNARSRDYAKIGRLYLNNGKWGEKQIISKDWINKTLEYSSDSTGNYYNHYSWRINRKGNFFAKGAMGQYIFVNPQKKIIIVRTGNEYGIDDWEEIFEIISG